LIGWVSATGSIDVLPVLLFAIIFLWTPPHFWALSLFVRSDYAAAKVPMLPVVAGIQNTRLQILLPFALGLTGPIYGITAAVLNTIFVVLAAAVFANRAEEPSGMKPERKLFAFSILYLFVLFAALVVDRWVTP
jgi:protoheme IX farnesyltransferase